MAINLTVKETALMMASMDAENKDLATAIIDGLTDEALKALVLVVAFNGVKAKVPSDLVEVVEKAIVEEFAEKAEAFIKEEKLYNSGS